MKGSSWYEQKCVTKLCDKKTRHKSGVCEPCRKSKVIRCEALNCLTKALREGFCSKHLKKNRDVEKISDFFAVLEEEFDEGAW